MPAVVSFIDCINRRDLDGLLALMTDDHVLQVLDEAPVTGRDVLADAWNGYFTAYPDYLIYPQRIAHTGELVAVLGVTTGSHLDLPDEEEMKLPVIWTARVDRGRLRSWSIVADTPETRQELGLGA